jgi:hypothetical protein
MVLLTSQTYIALDLGAESGRAVVATLVGNKQTLNETQRFGNNPVRLPDGIRWIVRTDDQQASCIIELATIEVKGRLEEKARGKLKIVPPLGDWSRLIRIGDPDATEAAEMEQKIEEILSSYNHA